MDGYPYPVSVEGDWPPNLSKVIKQKLQIYFQSKKKSSGGDCAVQYAEGNRAVVVFKSAEIRQSVLSKTDHGLNVDGLHVKLKLNADRIPDEEPAARVPDRVGSGRGSVFLSDDTPAPKTRSGDHHEEEEDEEESPQFTAVVLENVQERVSNDLLELMVERICGCSCDTFTVELIYESNAAVVTFNNPEDVQKFISEGKHNKQFKKFGLSSRALERTCSMKVEDLPPQADEDLLMLYFEKWGFYVTRVDMIPKERAAIVTFSKQEDVMTLPEKKIIICNVPVKIHPYFKSLGTALYGKDRPRWKLPERFTERVHPAIVEFIKKKNQADSIHKQMEAVFCQVDFLRAEMQLSPSPALLKVNDMSGKHITGWRQHVSDTLKNSLSKYAVYEKILSTPLVGVVVKDIEPFCKNNVVVNIDDAGSLLTLAGMSKDIDYLKHKVEDVVQKVTAEMEREKNSVYEEMDVSPHLFNLLQQEGLQQYISISCPKLELTYKSNKLVLSGLKTEVLTMKTWLLEKKMEMEQKVLEIDSVLLEFLCKVNSEKMSEELLTSHRIKAILMVKDGKAILTGSSEKSLTDAERRLRDALSFQKITVHDQAVLRKPEWQDLVTKLQDVYNSKHLLMLISPSNQKDHLVVSGYQEPVREVSRNLQEFLHKHERIQETIRVKTYAALKFIREFKSPEWKSFEKSGEVAILFDDRRPRINLSGERVHVVPVIDYFSKTVAGLHTEELTIRKPAAKKYFQQEGSIFVPLMVKEKKCVILLQEDYMQEIDDQDDDSRRDQGIGFRQIFCEVEMHCGVQIIVSKANICSFEADAVVNASNEDLAHIGGLALALLNAAGPQLQEECNLHIKKKGKLSAGDAVVTKAGNLPNKCVVHAVGPRYHSMDKPTAVRKLKQAVRESLNLAIDNQCSSVAMPAISSGIFGFPLDLCADTIAKTLRDYFENSFNGGVLTKVYLVNNDDKTVNAMAEAVKSVFKDMNPRSEWEEAHSWRHDGQRKEHRKRRIDDHGGTSHQHHSSHEGRWSYGESKSQEDIESRRTSKGLLMLLRKGNIQDASTRVIVNTVATNLELSQGAISKALLQAAGPKLQAAVLDKKQATGYGSVVVTDGYQLRCQKVFHAICPPWDSGNGNAEKVLRTIMQNCLVEAENQRMNSITFPAIGTGNLGFPKDLVSAIMLEEAENFSSKNSPQHLHEVAILLHPSDQGSIESFSREFRGEKRRVVSKGFQTHDNPGAPAFNKQKAKHQKNGEVIGQVSTPTLGVHTMNIGQLTLEVSSGDITKETTEAIVNSSNSNFSLKAGVSKAILEAAGQSVENECSSIVQSRNFQGNSQMILTSAGMLQCKKIIHIVGSSQPKAIEDIVYSVLKICEENKFTSVSFPAVGTGQGGGKAFEVASAMIDAVVEFVKKKNGQSLKLVRILVFQTEMVPSFHQVMQQKQGQKLFEEGWIDKVKGFLGFGGTEDTEDGLAMKEQFSMEHHEFEPAVFQMCGESVHDVIDCKDWLRNLIEKEHTAFPIQDPLITYLTMVDADELKNMQRKLSVSIRLENMSMEPVIHVEGLTRDVYTAERRIRDMIKKVERQENQKREAFMFSSIVQWHYHDQQNSHPFEMIANYELEMGHRTKTKVSVQFKNQTWIADFVKNEISNGKTTFVLSRVDVKDDKSIDLPDDWDDMKGSIVIEVDVPAGSPEYSKVEREFRGTGLNNKITKIDRVQNGGLWKNYMIKKKQMEDKNKHTNNEKNLFHGTSHNSINLINHHGFNRSYAGVHGAMYGNGAYFAVDPAYSARGYAKPDQTGLKRMYLAKVLVGDFTQGRAGLLAPPARSSGNSADLYDSVTDNSARPSMFVIFNDVQAYPEYVITFQ
ncbi:protein mono-ADP-ribosyltransferase PARP14-like [Denticeps clupeoides]|nr:protein mono-ADP-ribosyltransferase PARP14 [Denticeps clupeoides]